MRMRDIIMLLAGFLIGFRSAAAENKLNKEINDRV